MIKNNAGFCCAITNKTMILFLTSIGAFDWFGPHWVLHSGIIQRKLPRVILLPPANEVWGKVIFSEACVKNSVHRGRGSASVHAGIPPGTRHTPPGTRHPLDQAPPLNQASPRAEHTGRYGQRAGGTHPTGMQSCIITAYIRSLWEGNVFSHVFLCSQPGRGLDIRPGVPPASDIWW